MKKFLFNALLVIFIGVFLVSGYFLLDYFLESKEQNEKYDDLAQIVESVRSNTPGKSGLGGVTNDDGNTEIVELVTVTDPETGEEVSVLAEYAELYTMNNDLVGWIQVPGTDINYPVMQSSEVDDYYLYVNFYNEYSNHGCIYAREECDFQTPSDNVTIYGHNMKDGSMFAPLHKYQDKAFWEENPIIRLDTLTEHHKYRIIAVFTTTASVGEGFSYQNFIDAASEKEFDRYVSTCQSLSLYDTGETAKYGDKLITLSTCEYTHTNGRLVVVAKRVS